MISNRLTINLSKSVYILVSNSKNCNTSNFHLSIKGNELQRKNSVKYLEVYIDQGWAIVFACGPHCGRGS